LGHKFFNWGGNFRLVVRKPRFRRKKKQLAIGEGFARSWKFFSCNKAIHKDLKRAVQRLTFPPAIVGKNS